MNLRENKFLRRALSAVRVGMVPPGSPAAAFAMEDYVEAAARFAALSEREPDNLSLRIGWANALSHARKKDEAARVIASAAALAEQAEQPDAGILRTLYELAAANGPPAVQRRLAQKLSELDPADDHIKLMPLAAVPEYRSPEWQRKLDDLGREILVKRDATTQALDLLCQLAAGAENARLTGAAAARLAVAVPREERHLLTWVQAATTLGTDMDPEPIVAVAATRPMTPALAGLLIPFARVCEITGRLDAALVPSRSWLEMRVA